MVKMDFPKELDDPTLTFDGTKCAEDSVSCFQKNFSSDSKF